MREKLIQLCLFADILIQTPNLCYDERKGKKGKCAPFSDDRCRKKRIKLFTKRAKKL